MKFNNISKLLIIMILSITNLEAGFIMKKIKSKAKDKIKDVVVNTTKDVYIHKKKKEEIMKLKQIQKVLYQKLKINMKLQSKK